MLTFLVSVTLAALLLWLWTRRARTLLPAELSAGRLVLNERPLYARHPCQLHCRVDQVWRAPLGHIPVETKSLAAGKPPRVWPNHIVQLSVQAACLAATGYPPAPFGFVRFVRAGSPPQYIKVALLDPARVSDVARAYRQVADGHRAPRNARHRIHRSGDTLAVTLDL